MHKITVGTSGDTPLSWPRVYRSEETSGPGRLAIAATEDPVGLIADLAECLGPEVYVLHVLVLPRGEREQGRYQSPLLPVIDVRIMLEEYSSALENDGRHHLWIGAPKGGGQVVYDHHNMVFAYGPLDEFESVLSSRQYSEGEFSIPFPHAHQFHSEYDGDFESLLSRWDWRRFDLRPGDDY